MAQLPPVKVADVAIRELFDPLLTKVEWERGIQRQNILFGCLVTGQTVLYAGLLA